MRLARLVPVLLVVLAGCGREPAPPNPNPLGYRNILRWETAWEKDNAGFDVYRSEHQQGPFERITAKPVPGAVEAQEKHAYMFEDTGIDPAKEYFYYVESIKTNGERVRLTGAFRVKAKAPH